MNLPPLPEPASINGLPGYTADQLRAYAEAAVLAERERCAQVCDELSSGLATGRDEGALICAAAIRALE